MVFDFQGNQTELNDPKGNKNITCTFKAYFLEKKIKNNIINWQSAKFAQRVV